MKRLEGELVLSHPSHENKDVARMGHPHLGGCGQPLGVGLGLVPGLEELAAAVGTVLAHDEDEDEDENQAGQGQVDAGLDDVFAAHSR